MAFEHTISFNDENKELGQGIVDLIFVCDYCDFFTGPGFVEHLPSVSSVCSFD